MVAVGRRPTELWGYVQRALLEQEEPPNGDRPERGGVTIQLPVSPTLRMREFGDLGWHNPRNEARAALHLHALEGALAKGRIRTASRCRNRWLRTLHTDRVQNARALASELGLRCDPMGHGPITDEPTVVYRDRLPWLIRPVEPYRDPNLPARAAAIRDEWNGIGELFDAFYRTDEPPTSQLTTHSLIGVISTGGLGDWFVLDRWAT